MAGNWYRHTIKKPTTSKYNNKKATVDGITFDSKKESLYYQKLKLAKQSGELLFFLRQVPFHLPGGVRYLLDFQEFWADGRVQFTDVKGYRTDKYLVKKKMVEDLYYPVQITEVS